MLVIDNVQVLRIGVYQSGRFGGTLPFVLVHVTEEVMSAIACDDCRDVELPSDIRIPSKAEVAFRNLTGYKYAPSTNEHWGVHTGGNRIRILERNEIL